MVLFYFKEDLFFFWEVDRLREDYFKLVRDGDDLRLFLVFVRVSFFLIYFCF